MVQGLVRLGDALLYIDWRQYDLFGNPKDELKTLEVPFPKIREFEYKKRFLSGVLFVHVIEPDVLKKFPMPIDSLTTLKIPVKRKHRDAAEGLSAELNLRLLEDRVLGDDM